MNRRQLCQAIALSLASVSLDTLLPARAAAALPDTRISRISIFNPSDESGLSGWINQSAIIVKVECDNGLVGIGQGGTRDLFDDIAGMLIGENPFRSEYLWSRMYRNKFYTPGREKLHAIGALDCALWDLKGKALDAPVYELLGGRTRNHIECYQSYGTLNVDNARDSARATMDAGFRAVRFHGIDYDANTGDPVTSACTGQVAFAGDSGNWAGKKVVVRCANGVKLTFAHLSRVNVAKGDVLTLSTKVGAVGSSGSSTGSHLHVGAELNGRSVNPSKYIPR